MQAKGLGARESSSCSSSSSFSKIEEDDEHEHESPKAISPCLTFRSDRDKWGVGVRHSLFPEPALGAPVLRGCRLPDAILHGKRSFRPRSRASRRLAARGFFE